MTKDNQYESKQPEISEVLDEIKSVDTSKYRSHPMVEKLLVFQVEELKKEIATLHDRCDTLSEENSGLNVQVAVYKERKSSENLLDWIRNITGIAMGISGGLIFSKEPLLSKGGTVATPILALIFLVSLVKAFSRKS